MNSFLIDQFSAVQTMGVGATGRNDELASFSSRGPSRYGVLKPDISAPGMSIRSCDCNGDSLYSVFSGTSMSCPNSAGVIALMVGKDRAITYDRVNQIRISEHVPINKTLRKAIMHLNAYVF